MAPQRVRKKQMNDEPQENKQISKHATNDPIDALAVWIIGAILILAFFNTYQTHRLRDVTFGPAPGPVSAANMQMSNQGLTIEGVIPTGVPAIYGKELGISFDDVTPSDPRKADAVIGKIGLLDRQLQVSGAELQRYIAITSRISCEYCCGAPSIIADDGSPACGCAHSFAMRGLAKYLIKNHGDEYTDDAILEELGKWKTLFFPGKLMQKASVLKQKGIELNYINLASNKYRGIETGSVSGASAMVGGC